MEQKKIHYLINQFTFYNIASLSLNVASNLFCHVFAKFITKFINFLPSLSSQILVSPKNILI